MCQTFVKASIAQAPNALTAEIGAKSAGCSEHGRPVASDVADQLSIPVGYLQSQAPSCQPRHGLRHTPILRKFAVLRLWFLEPEAAAACTRSTLGACNQRRPGATSLGYAAFEPFSKGLFQEVVLPKRCRFHSGAWPPAEPRTLPDHVDLRDGQNRSDNFKEGEHVGIEKADHLFRNMRQGAFAGGSKSRQALASPTQERRPRGPSVILSLEVHAVKIDAAIPGIEATR